MPKAAVAGHYNIKHKRGGRLLREASGHNGITDLGLDLLLDSTFNGATQSANWYLGLLAANAVVDAADTMVSHAGWTEFVGHTSPVRLLWDAGASADNVSGRRITNASPTIFTVNADGTVAGLFVTSNNVLAGATGHLWATAEFDEPLEVQISDTIEITYTVSATDANEDV